MEKLLQEMGFNSTDAEKINGEIQKFVSAEEEIRQIKKEIKTIKISLILIAGMLGLSIVS